MAAPEKTFRKGSVSASVFANEFTGKDGKQFTTYKVVPQKVYMGKDGKLANTDSFGVNEIPRIIIALTNAYDYLISQKEEE